MRIIWHSQAKKGKRQVAEYIRKWFGIQRVKKSRQDIDQTAIMLMQYPNLGFIDPLLLSWTT
jgi:hypothetical protein